MLLGQALFSFQGRMSRSDFWRRGVLPMVPVSLVNGLVFWSSLRDGPNPVCFAIALVMLWPALAVHAKRLHDRGRSAWLMATLLIPVAQIAFAVWILVVCGFLRGRAGENRFGPDPLAPATSSLQAPAGRPAPWTRPDLRGGPRFLALVASVGLSVLAAILFSGWTPLFLHHALGAPPSVVGLVGWMRVPGAIAGALLAWVASRRPFPVLVWAGALQCAGDLLLWLSVSHPVALAAALLHYAGLYGVLLGVAVSFLRGRASARSLVLAFGACVLSSAVAVAAGYGLVPLANYLGIRVVLGTIPVVAVLALFFLLGASGPLLPGVPAARPAPAKATA